MTEARRFFKKISNRLLPDRKDLREFLTESVSPTDQIGKNGDWTGEVKEQSYYRDKLARKLRGKTEIKTPDGGRIAEMLNLDIKLYICSDKSLWHKIKAPMDN